MGSRGAGSGRSGEIALSNKIKDQFIQSGLNSNIAGIRKKAAEGTGNYSYKDAKAVSYEDAKKMIAMQVHEKGENTLIDGVAANGKHVFYANKTDTPQIKALKEKADKQGSSERSTQRQDLTGKTTTTYDRWRKRNKNNFDAYWNGK